MGYWSSKIGWSPSSKCWSGRGCSALSLSLSHTHSPMRKMTFSCKILLCVRVSHLAGSHTLTLTSERHPDPRGPRGPRTKGMRESNGASTYAGCGGAAARRRRRRHIMQSRSFCRWSAVPPSYPESPPPTWMMLMIATISLFRRLSKDKRAR